MAKARKKRKKYKVKFDMDCPSDLQEWLLSKGTVKITATEVHYRLIELDVEETI